MRVKIGPATVLLLLGLLATAGLAVADTTEPDGDLSPPYLIPESRVSPEYPPSALAARYDGTVVMSVKVLQDGAVDTVDVLDSTRPNLGFEKSAERAVKKWRFEPAVKNGAPVDAYAVVQLAFRAAPPGSRSGGFVAANFVPLEEMGHADFTLSPTRTFDPGLITPSQFLGIPMRKPVKPDCDRVGCMYDRRDLFPLPAEHGNQPNNGGGKAAARPCKGIK